jgi:PadR family transcriptional regulator AphA
VYVMSISIDHTILGIISLAPCSGYDLKAACEWGEIGLVSMLSYGSIYPRLKQLEQQGLIEIQQASNEGRRRKVYELTTRGWQELIEWLELPAEYPFPMEDELLLKMLFWGATGADRTTLLAHLEARRAVSQEVLTHIVERSTDGISFIDEYAAFVLDYMRSRLEAELAWIAETMAQLEKPEHPPVQDPHWLSVLQKARRAKAQVEQQEMRGEQKK